MHPLNIPSLEAILSARQRLQGLILRTPLIRFLDEESQSEIYVKLENLQPTGSFKVRGAGNALMQLDQTRLVDGVWTASAGNMGLALAWHARRQNIACTVIVPHDAPKVKLNAIQSLGAKIVTVPFSDYQAIQREGRLTDMKGWFVHPFADEDVMAGNATIGIEICEDMPDVDTIFVPYGGGGLSCGISAWIRALGSNVRVVAVELDTASPLTSSLSAGKLVEVPYQASFVSGMGAPFVFPQMWPLAKQLLDGSSVVNLARVASAIRALAQKHHVIAEGAGAVALAAALDSPSGKKVACIVSGGNINSDHLVKILNGEMP